MTEGPWESIDGIGGPDVAEFGDLLVVRQCQRTQIDVACMLAGLRSKSPSGSSATALPAEARLHATLDNATSIEFSGTPLRDVISYISEIHKVPILFDSAGWRKRELPAMRKSRWSSTASSLHSAFRCCWRTSTTSSWMS